MKVQIPRECTAPPSGKEIVCLGQKDGGDTFLNPNQKVVWKHTIDGCQQLRASLPDGTADFVTSLLWIGGAEHYVELKGKNVEHALHQLRSTISQISSTDAKSRLYCWIITTESPRTTAKFQVLKQRFENEFKRFNARVTIHTNQHSTRWNGSQFMPIYEFACPKCRKIFNFLSKRPRPDHAPACPKCGNRKMTKQISPFAMPRGVQEPSAAAEATPGRRVPCPTWTIRA